MAIAYLNHTPIGKATQAQPYTAAAHLRYITRKNATDYVYSERMPVQYHAAQRFLTNREDSIRKNGRVCDKLIIALPREMSMAQSVDALRDFGDRLTEGRAPFLFSIQDFNDTNPHAHFVLVDADTKTGKRVFGTSERDSTERIKAIWADTCNEHLQELGVDAEIKFGPPDNDHFVGVNEMADNAVERLELEPACASPSEPVEAVEPPAPERPQMSFEESEAEDLSEGMESHIETGSVEPHERIRAALETHTEWEILREEREELARLQEQVKAAEQRALDRHTDFNIAAYDQAKAGQVVDMARRQFEQAPRGFHLSIGRFEWKSKARKTHEATQGILEAAKYRLAVAQQKTAEENIEAARAAREAIELDQKRHRLEFHLRTRGTEKELDEAETLFENTIAVNMKDMTPGDVWAEMAAGTITEEEALRTLRMMGEHKHADWYEELDEHFRKGQENLDDISM